MDMYGLYGNHDFVWKLGIYKEMYGFLGFCMDLYGWLWVCMDISWFHFLGFI